jgi:hypothetical protein
MHARAAATLSELGLREQRRCPLKPYELLGDREHVAEEIHDDHAQRPHVTDPIFAAHAREYASVDRLRSRESLVAMESTALVVPETTQHVEMWHAEVKRDQHGRDQNHKESLSVASAMRII